MKLVIKFNTDHEYAQTDIITIEQVGEKTYKASCFAGKIIPRPLLVSAVALLVQTNMFCNAYIKYYLDDILYASSPGSGHCDGDSAYAQSRIEYRISQGLDIMALPNE